MADRKKMSHEDFLREVRDMIVAAGPAFLASLMHDDHSVHAPAYAVLLMADWEVADVVLALMADWEPPAAPGA